MVTIHPIIIIIFERFVFKIKFKAIVWLGVIVAFIGSIIIGYSDFDGNANYSNPLLGNSLAAFAAIIFAGYFLIGNRIRQKRIGWIMCFQSMRYAAITCLVALLVVDGYTHGYTHCNPSGFWTCCRSTNRGTWIIKLRRKVYFSTLLSTLILFEPAVSSLLAFLFLEKFLLC